MAHGRVRGGGWRRAAPRALLLAAAALSNGCAASKPFVTPPAYAIDPPEPRSDTGSPAGAVVSLARVDVAPPYAGVAFVYRFDEHRVELDPYARFAASPGWMLTSAIRGYLREAAFIRDVVTPAGDLPVDASIEASAGELYGDLSGTQAAAILALHFRVLSSPGGDHPVRELFQKGYAQRIAVSKRSPADLARGWNEALSQIMQAFLADLEPVLAPRS